MRNGVACFAIAGGIVAGSMLPGRLAAQQPDSALRTVASEAALPGARFRLTTIGGAQVVGPLQLLADSAFRISGVSYSIAQTALVERWHVRSDPIWNGVAIGSALGVVFGGVLPSLFTADTSHQPSRASLIIGGAVWGGLIGGVADYAIGRRADWTVLWRRP